MFETVHAETRDEEAEPRVQQALDARDELRAVLQRVRERARRYEAIHHERRQPRQPVEREAHADQDDQQADCRGLKPRYGEDKATIPPWNVTPAGSRPC
ncbi:MAG: hypothetical protein U1F09_15865 [Steroidobacteraceae bacterium]